MSQLSPEDLAQKLMAQMKALEREVEDILASSDQFHKDFNIPRNFITTLLSSDDMPEHVRDRANETLWLWQREVDEELNSLTAAAHKPTQKKRSRSTIIRI